MKRAPHVLAVAAAAALLTPAAALASDPLLSGYSGPGGGEQTILGSGVAPGGSLRAPSRGAPRTVNPAQARAIVAAAPLTATPTVARVATAQTSAQSPVAARGSDAKSAGRRRTADSKPDGPAAPASTTRAPYLAVDYPAQQAAASSFVSGGSALTILAVLIALIAAGLLMGRLTRPSPLVER